MILRTPLGTPARSQSSAMIPAAPGSRSDGFITSVLPVAIAIGIVQRGIMAGLCVTVKTIRACFFFFCLEGRMAIVTTLQIEGTDSSTNTKRSKTSFGVHILGDFKLGSHQHCWDTTCALDDLQTAWKGRSHDSGKYTV